MYNHFLWLVISYSFDDLGGGVGVITLQSLAGNTVATDAVALSDSTLPQKGTTVDYFPVYYIFILFYSIIHLSEFTASLITYSSVRLV